MQNKLRLKASIFEEAVHTTEQGFQYIAQNEINYDQQTHLMITDERDFEITALKKAWGIFDIATIITTKGNELFSKTALLGGSLKEKPALYLADQFQPLVVVGGTKIDGKVYLPEQGIKRGSIAGHSYQGSQLIYGSIAQSTNKLPELKNLEYMRNIKEYLLANAGNIFVELNDEKKVINSFDQPTNVIGSSSPFHLQYVELTGNIIIYSDSKITVYPSAKLQDVILIAPGIEVKDGVQGNFQAFAEKKIIVGKNCIIKYPSAFLLIESNTSNTQGLALNPDHEDINQIIIDENSDIRGIVAFISKEIIGSSNYKPQIVIEENATIMGEVYCNGNIELKGIVKGSVYANGFIANQFGGIYKNHIYNGQIVSSENPIQYSGLVFNNSKQTVAKWLNY